MREILWKKDQKRNILKERFKRSIAKERFWRNKYPRVQQCVPKFAEIEIKIVKERLEKKIVKKRL